MRWHGCGPVPWLAAQKPGAAALVETQPASPAAGGWTGSTERASAIKPAGSPGTAASTTTGRVQVGGWARGGATSPVTPAVGQKAGHKTARSQADSASGCF